MKKISFTTLMVIGLYIVVTFASPGGACMQGTNTGIIIMGIAGDVNMDGEVNLTDLALLGQSWGAHSGDPNYNGCADFNNDLVIDLKDQAILGQHWGEKGFYTEAIYTNSPAPIIPRAWLKGTWFIGYGENKVAVDCKQLGGVVVAGVIIRVLSEGDIIEDAIRYSHDSEGVNESIDPKVITWFIAGGSESWLLTITDNGNQHIKIELMSLAGGGGVEGPGCTASQEIEITW